MTEAVSHGRGGAGNINPDNTEYVDGEIRREEDPAALGEPYSTGRGGGGNIASPAPRPTSKGGDGDVVPEAAKVVPHEGEAYHSGRGGEGNVNPATATAETKPDSTTEKKPEGYLNKNAPAKKGIADKIKDKIRAFLSKAKDHKRAGGTKNAPAATEQTASAEAK